MDHKGILALVKAAVFQKIVGLKFSLAKIVEPCIAHPLDSA